MAKAPTNVAASVRDKFVLKGGMLVTLWTVDPGRFTRDVDFLGFGEGDAETLTAIFADILSVDAADGLVFDTANLTASEIREDQMYGGKRLRTNAYLEKTRIPVTVDLGFGDALSVFAVSCRLTYPWNLLGLPALSLPCGVDGKGLPTGLQVAGPAMGEAAVIRCGLSVERSVGGPMGRVDPVLRAQTASTAQSD